MDNKYQNHKHMNITVQSYATFNQKIIELSYLSIGWEEAEMKKEGPTMLQKNPQKPISLCFSFCVLNKLYWDGEESNVLMYGLDLYGFWNI